MTENGKTGMIQIPHPRGVYFKREDPGERKAPEKGERRRSR